MQQTDPTTEVTNHVSLALQLLDEGDTQGLQSFLAELHPVKVEALVGSLEGERQEQVLGLLTGLDQVADLVAYAGESLRERMLGLLDDKRIAAVVRRLEVDDAADVIAELPRRRQVSILRRIAPETARELTSLLAYEDETAGAIMTTLYAYVRSELTSDEALNELRRKLQTEEIDPDTYIGYLYVVDQNDHLVGVTSLRELFTSATGTPITELMRTDLVSVGPEEDQETAARIIADYDLTAIPVVAAESGRILGIITVDDVLDVIEDELTEDLLKLAGTEDSDIVGATTTTAVKSRLPWLLASWLGGIGGAMLLGTYSTMLEKLVTLAFFMPVVFGMAGNVGSQSSTITVRGIATGELIRFRILSRLRKEAATGLSLGIFFGFLLSVVAYLLYQDLELSLTVGCSICVTMTCAAIFGSMLPLVFNKLGFDPAVSSGPFVTTTTDIISITIYFSIASLFL